MLIELLTLTAAMLATGIETAFVPTDEGGGEYLVRVEPDLVSSESPYTFTSDIPDEKRDVRRVCIYVANKWPASVERTVIENRVSVCGYGPIMSLMEYARFLSPEYKIKILARGHSGEVTPSPEVVDYISLIAYE